MIVVLGIRLGIVGCLTVCGELDLTVGVGKGSSQRLCGNVSFRQSSIGRAVVKLARGGLRAVGLHRRTDK